MTAAGAAPLVVTDAWNDERVRDLPPVATKQVGAYLGIPLSSASGRVIGALCVFGPDPRAWSDDDVATLRQLADSAVTELELSALVEQYETDRLRWGLAIDAAGIGTFDWDLVTGRLTWDDRLITLFGYERGSFDQTIEAFNARLHPDDLLRVTDAMDTAIDDLRGVRHRVPRRPAGRRDPLGARPRPGAGRPGRLRRPPPRRGQ